MTELLSIAPVVRFTGVVLAGGRSTRMGRDKALLAEAAGPTLLARAVETLRAAGATEVVVSVAAERRYAHPGTREVVDPAPDRGPLAGIAAALAATDAAEWIVVVSVDLARLRPEFVRELLGQAVSRGRGVVPADARGLQPLAAVYPRRPETGAAAEAELARGRGSVRAWAQALRDRGQVDFWAVGDAWTADLTNCNTPEDWAAAQATVAARDRAGTSRRSP